MTARDARRAALRALIAGGGPALLALVVGGTRVDPAFLLACVSVALGIFVLAWLEMRAWADEASFRMPLAVGVAAAVAVCLLPVQVEYTAGLLETGSLDQALERVARMGGPVGPLLLFVGALSAPFAVAADLHRHGRARQETTLVAFAAVAPAGCLSLGVGLAPCLIVGLALLIVYGIADRLEALLWPSASRAEHAAYWQRSRDRGYARRWLLAYLDHPPARLAEGASVPPAPRDLDAFLEQLRPGGRSAYEHTALILVRLLLPFVRDFGRSGPHDAVRARGSRGGRLRRARARRRAARAGRLATRRPRVARVR